MYYLSFVFQVHNIKPGIEKCQEIYIERMIKSLKMRRLASLLSSVYHLNLGWEKMEIKKLCGESNYLSNQSGTDS